MLCYFECDVDARGGKCTLSLNKFYTRLALLKTPDGILSKAKKMFEKIFVIIEVFAGHVYLFSK